MIKKSTVKKTSIMVLPILLFASVVGCTPTQINKAKRIMGQASFYTTMARSLIKVAEGYIADNKVKTALEATRESLKTVESTIVLIDSGLDKDQVRIITAVTSLMVNVFALAAAIKKAKDANSGISPPMSLG
jgi:hypothetical protein